MNKKEGIPGEYEKHYATIAMYPVRNDIWRNNAKNMQEFIIRLVNIVATYEKVFFICPIGLSTSIQQSVSKNVELIEMDYDDIWARDISPSFVFDKGNLTCVDWKFNAWGGKKEGAYYPWNSDDDFAQNISNLLRLHCKRESIVLEGGAIISDGNGTIFTTRSVLLNRNRNPFKSKDYIEEILINSTRSQKVIWIKQGLISDETNGHIDNVLSVINSREICIAWTDDRSNPNYNRVRAIYECLADQTNCYGEPYIIHKIPLPPLQYMKKNESLELVANENALERKEGDMLPASYLNFYMLNGAVIIPSFNVDMDADVYSIFESLFPDRKIIQINAREALLGGGGIHCLLHEVPFLR